MPPAKQLKPKFKVPSKLKVRKHLKMDAMLSALYQGFSALPDHRRGKVEIPLSDALMAGLAMFLLKDPSLLAFDERRRNDGNPGRIYGIGKVPSDTQMREILDPLDPQQLRPLFNDIFRQLQRGKALEPMAYFKGCYLLSLDGTGSFSSEKLSSASCLVKKSRSGKETYYQQVLGAAIVHPDLKEVIPLAPEMIIRQDGSKKNDCERNAARRFLQKLRQDHPHLPLIVVEDALSANGPHIRNLQQHQMHYILGVKPGDHPLLFHHLEEAAKREEVTEHTMADPQDPKVTHVFRFLGGVPLNQSHLDLPVNVIEYWQCSEKKNFAFQLGHRLHGDQGQRLCAHARGPRPLEDRERDLQHAQESGLPLRAQLRAGQEAPERSLRHSDDARLSGRPDPTAHQRPVSQRLAEVRRQALAVGERAKPLSRL